MTSITQVGHFQLAALAVLTAVILGIPLIIYWMNPEEQMANFLISVLLLLASVWLTVFWVVKVVSPSIEVAAGSAVTEMDQVVHNPKRIGTASRWILGLGIPLVIVSMDTLSLVYFWHSWIGALISVAYVVFLVKALHDNSFFTQQEDSENLTQPESHEE